jgi:hypothetical protein
MSVEFKASMKRAGVRELVEDLTGDLGWACVFPEADNRLKNYCEENVTCYPDIEGEIRKDFALAYDEILKVENPPEEIVLVYGISGNRGVCSMFAFEDFERCMRFVLTKCLPSWSFLSFPKGIVNYRKLNRMLPEILEKGFFSDGENTVWRGKFAEVKAAFEVSVKPE